MGPESQRNEAAHQPTLQQVFVPSIHLQFDKKEELEGACSFQRVCKGHQ